MAFDKASSELQIASIALSREEQADGISGAPAFWAAKRCFDIAGSLALLPVLALVALALVALNPFQNPGQLIFRQRRMGRYCAPFTAFKFRSMLPAQGPPRLADDPLETHRITPLGALLRKSRFDELPQIINVLRGEMSLIGPRPDFFDHAVDYLHAIPEYRARHAVRPGISGFAQVSLGYAEGIAATQAKAAADLCYVQNASFTFEAKIVWLTLVTVFTGRGA